MAIVLILIACFYLVVRIIDRGDGVDARRYVVEAVQCPCTRCARTVIYGPFGSEKEAAAYAARMRAVPGLEANVWVMREPGR